MRLWKPFTSASFITRIEGIQADSADGRSFVVCDSKQKRVGPSRRKGQRGVLVGAGYCTVKLTVVVVVRVPAVPVTVTV